MWYNWIDFRRALIKVVPTSLKWHSHFGSIIDTLIMGHLTKAKTWLGGLKVAVENP
jgi:hypothetical protein